MRENLRKAILSFCGIVMCSNLWAVDYVTTTVNSDDATKQDVTYIFGDRSDAAGLAIDDSSVAATVYSSDGESTLDLYSLTTEGLERLALDANVNSSSSSAENGLWWWRTDRSNGDGYDYQDGLQLRGGSSYTGGLAVLNLQEGDQVVIYGVAVASTGSNFMLINFPGADRIDDEAQDPCYKGEGEAEYTVEYSNATSTSSYGTITIDVTSSGYVAAYVTGNNNGYIKTITITEAASGATVSYTVKFVDEEGNTLKETETRSGVEGAEISLTDDDKASLTVDDTKYVYESYSSTADAVEEGMVITVTYREAQAYTYIIYATLGDIEQIYASGEEYEGETVLVPYPVNILYNGTLYSTSQTNSKWAISITIDPDGTNEATIAYTASSTTGVLYLIEGEDIDGFLAISDLSSQSMLAAGYAENGSAEIVTLAPGEYTIGARFYKQSSSISSTWTFKVGEETVWEYASYAGTSYSDTFTVESEDVLSVEMDTIDGTVGIDFLYIYGTGDITTGISKAATSVQEGDGTYYNLQGMRVANPSKGLYILNGKKVIVK